MTLEVYTFKSVTMCDPSYFQLPLVFYFIMIFAIITGLFMFMAIPFKLQM